MVEIATAGFAGLAMTGARLARLGWNFQHHTHKLHLKTEPATLILGLHAIRKKYNENQKNVKVKKEVAMKIGFNMLLWTTHVTEEHFPLLEKLKAAGYDGVEVPVFEGNAAHFEKVSRVLKDNGLAATVVTVIPDQEHSPISTEARHRQGAVTYLKWAIDCAQALGAEVLVGRCRTLRQRRGSGATFSAAQKRFIRKV